MTTALKDVIRADGQWIVVGARSTLLTSPDGLTWTPRSLEGVGGATFDLNGVAFGNGAYLVVGDGSTGINGSLFRSVDGARWNLVPYSFGKNLRGITFDQGTFAIAGNDGLVATTTDGVAYGGGWGRGGGNLRGVAWTYDRWTIAGNDGFVGTLEAAAGPVAPRAVRLGVHLHRAVAHRGKVVAIGNHGTILQSDTVAATLESPVRRPDGTVAVGLLGLRDRVYRLQAATQPGDWTTLTVLTNRGDRVEHVDAEAARTPYRFYRLHEE